MAESGQESIKAMSQEEHKAIHRAGQQKTISPERLAEMMGAAELFAKLPCVVSINEIDAKDIYAALWELQEYRQSELRPAEKFLTNTLDQQMQHIEQEFNEVRRALREYQEQKAFQNCFLERPGMIQKTCEHLKEELADLKTSCTTMEAIMGMNAADRRAEVRKVNAKNARRNYFDRAEGGK